MTIRIAPSFTGRSTPRQPLPPGRQSEGQGKFGLVEVRPFAHEIGAGADQDGQPDDAKESVG